MITSSVPPTFIKETPLFVGIYSKRSEKGRIAQTRSRAQGAAAGNFLDKVLVERLDLKLESSALRRGKSQVVGEQGCAPAPGENLLAHTKVGIEIMQDSFAGDHANRAGNSAFLSKEFLSSQGQIVPTRGSDVSHRDDHRLTLAGTQQFAPHQVRADTRPARARNAHHYSGDTLVIAHALELARKASGANCPPAFWTVHCFSTLDRTANRHQGNFAGCISQQLAAQGTHAL